MSLNWIIVLILVAIGMAYTNPEHHQHHAALSPVFLEYVQRAHGTDLKHVQTPWTFLPKQLAYRNYFVFSTASFPDQRAAEKTPAQGTLTVGLLGKVFVLFPKSIGAATIAP